MVKTRKTRSLRKQRGAGPVEMEMTEPGVPIERTRSGLGALRKEDLASGWVISSERAINYDMQKYHRIQTPEDLRYKVNYIVENCKELLHAFEERITDPFDGLFRRKAKSVNQAKIHLNYSPAQEAFIDRVYTDLGKTITESLGVMADPTPYKNVRSSIGEKTVYDLTPILLPIMDIYIEGRRLFPLRYATHPRVARIFWYNEDTRGDPILSRMLIEVKMSFRDMMMTGGARRRSTRRRR